MIANKDYSYSDAIEVPYADRDALKMKEFLINRLCYRAGNIHILNNATFNQLRRWLGDASNPEGDLWFRATPGRSNVFVYYSGHGAPNVDSSRAMLVPIDTDPNRPYLNYSFDWLDKNLKALKRRLGRNRSVTLMLETCFSGRSAGGPLLNHKASFRPSIPDPDGQIIRLTAATRTQIAYWDDQAQQGLFTGIFLEGVNGEADQSPSGNQDGTVTSEELFRYLQEQVPYRSRLMFQRDQTPELPSASLLRWRFKAGSEERDWKAISASRREADYRSFLSKYPNSRFRGAATARLNELGEWRRVEFTNNPQDLIRFRTRFPDGLFAREVDQRYDALDDRRWNDARYANNPVPVRDYIRLFSDGRHIDDARRLLDRLDTDMWNRIRNTTSCGQFDEYLRLFPTGRHSHEVADKKRACEKPRVPQVAFYNQLDFYLDRGHDLDSFHTRDVEQCALRCRENRSCRAFTFNSNSRIRYPKANCYIKRSRGIPDGNRYAISGLILAPGEQAPVFRNLGVIDHEGDRMRNLDFSNDPDLPKYQYPNTGSFYLCRIACIRREDCAGFTYVKGVRARNACWLKSSVSSPVRKRPRRRKTWTSGRKNYRDFHPFAVRPWR